MTVNTRKFVEREIVTALVKEALSLGYALSVNNGGDEDECGPLTDADAVLAELFATDDEHLIYHKNGKRVGWVWLIHGNGVDVISDYTTNLEKAMTEANKVYEKFA